MFGKNITFAEFVYTWKKIIFNFSFLRSRSLPIEIGELTQLREFSLNHNQLRQLPYELGKLFNIYKLGLKGNPLHQDILNLYNEPNGTRKLLEYMLDNLHGKKCFEIFYMIFHFKKEATLSNCVVKVAIELLFIQISISRKKRYRITIDSRWLQRL